MIFDALSQMRYVKQRGHGGGRGADDEENDGVHRPTAELIMQFTFGFHRAINRAVHHEQSDSRDAKQKRIGLKQAKKRSGKLAIGINGNPLCDVPHRHPDEQRR